MDIEIRQIDKKDFKKARLFAQDGMHLSWYVKNKLELYFYSKYVLYLELSKSTQTLGAYLGDELVGVLLASFKGRPVIFNSKKYTNYCKIINFLISNIGYKNSATPYDKANIEMLEEFKKNNKPDGEITFFAVNPKLKGKGIGTMLLNELERREKGKLVYLYSDTGSTYQFYLQREFIESGKREIRIPLVNKEVKLTCFLLTKRF